MGTENPDLRQALSVADLSKTGIVQNHLPRRAEAASQFDEAWPSSQRRATKLQQLIST
jgi:hypothetical protein